MNIEEAKRFAEHWAGAWNRHDIDAVLEHYTDDFEMTTPMIQRLLGEASGTLKGKAAIGAYWRAALRKIPNLKFSIIAVVCGVDSVCIYYDSVLGKKAIEVFHFDNNAKVYKAFAAYD